MSRANRRIAAFPACLLEQAEMVDHIAIHTNTDRFRNRLDANRISEGMPEVVNTCTLANQK